MLSRKLLVWIFSVMFNFFIVTSASADIGAAYTIEQGVRDIIAYLTSASTIEKQAEAELIYMEPPGTNQAAENTGIAITSAEMSLKDKLLPKAVSDINWGLYGTPRENEKVVGNSHANFINNHKSWFCSPNSGVEHSLDEKACKENETSIERQHADLKVSLLLQPSIYDQSHQILAEEVIRTLTVPFPETKAKNIIKDGLAKNSDKKYMARAMANQAAINVATNSLNEIYASRLPELAPTTPPKAVSIISVMENEAERRFKNKDWYDAVQQSSNEALLRELVHMEAYKLWVEYYRYKQNERIETLLAVMLAKNVEQSAKLLEMAQPQQ